MVLETQTRAREMTAFRFSDNFVYEMKTNHRGVVFNTRDNLTWFFTQNISRRRERERKRERERERKRKRKTER